MPKLLWHQKAQQYYVVLNTNNIRKTVYLGKDKPQAEIEYHKLLANFLKNKKNAVKKEKSKLFRDLADKYLTYIENRIKDNNISKDTAKDYKTILSVIVKLFPNHRCVDVNLQMIDELKDYLLHKRVQVIRKKKGVTADRFNRYTTCIRQVFNYGLEYGHITHADIGLPRKRREPYKRPMRRYITDEELEKIFALEHTKIRFKGEKHQATIKQTLDILRFGLGTGRRPQEVFGLRKKDIDLEQMKYIVVADKTARTNPVQKIGYLTESLVYIIKPYYDIRSDENEYVFQNEKGRKIITQCFNQRLEHIAKCAGIKSFTFKDFRHKFATSMIESGEPIENVSKLLFHTNINTTQIYVHQSDQALRDSIERFQKTPSARFISRK